MMMAKNMLLGYLKITCDHSCCCYYYNGVAFCCWLLLQLFNA